MLAGSFNIQYVWKEWLVGILWKLASGPVPQGRQEMRVVRGGNEEEMQMK